MKKEDHRIEHLSEIERENPFRVPENYFEELPGRIVQKVQSPPLKKYGAARRVLQHQLALAAAFLILVCAGYVATNLILAHQRNLPAEYFDIANYIEKNIDLFDETELLEWLDEAEPETAGEMTGDDIIQYLLVEDIDESIILNELY